MSTVFIPRLIMFFAVLFLLVTASLAVAESPSRATLSLDGTWNFRLDPNEVGEGQQWPNAGVSFPDRIQVPGAWDAQGFGAETEKLKHNYVGKAWYRRRVDLPKDWEGRQVFLCFGGVYRAARVWVNGQAAGSHIGYTSNFEFDITQFAAAGSPADIVVEVDSEQHWESDPLLGCMDIIDGMYTGWGGIWSHVSLEARPQTYLRDLYIAPRTAPAGCTLSAAVIGATVTQVRAEVLDAKGRMVATKVESLTKGEEVRVSLDLPGARLWTPETPYLYTARLTLLDDAMAEIDQLQHRFGVRTIEVRGTDFFVNGVKRYLNGYGDDCVYPDTIAPPACKQFYLDRLRVAKSYGFNYVRHHSHFVAPEYYEACDELGMFVSPELPIGYPAFYARALKSPQAMELYRTEWTALLKRYRNHASIFDWCMCNEVWEGMTELAPGLYNIAKELDPSRPVIDSDGLFMPGFIDGTKDRPTLDFYTVMFDIISSPLDKPDKFKTGKPLKPIVTHEEGNFVHFPRLDQIALYKTFKPFWLTDARDRVERAGLLEEAPDWSEASQQLYLLLHKSNIEALRKNPYISGYDWWLLQPWYAGSNGLLDGVRRPTSNTPEEVRQFNAPLVLLQDGIQATYRGRDTLKASISISNYSGKPLHSEKILCMLERDGKTLDTQKIALGAVEDGAVAALGEVTFTLPDVSVPQQLTVRAVLKSGSLHQSNNWPLWVYPSEPPRLAGTTPVFASPDAMGLLEGCAAQNMPENAPLPERAVYVARQPNEALFRAAEAGSCVVLLSPAGVFATDVTSYKSAWWLGVFDGDSNAGTFVYDNPVTKGMTSGRWCDASWFHLLQGAQTLLLDELPAQPEVLVRALNTHGSPAGMSRHADFDYVWRNKSLLAQAKVGKGSLIISGLNFDAARRNGGPEVSYLMARIISHAQTLPTPKGEWSVAFLEERLERSAFVTGPLVNGYQKLLSHHGEVTQLQSYRSREAKTLAVRQNDPLQSVLWETAPTPAAERAIFVFAANLSFQLPQMGRPGYGLRMNGKNILFFDNVKTQTLWKSDDQQSALMYVPAQVIPSWSMSAGLFYLSVPKALFTPGESCQLEVYSRGTDDKRTFGLQPYDDLLSNSPIAASATMVPVSR